MPLLEVKNLSAGYGNKEAVHQVSLTIQQSEIVGMIGHNGAGKTSTLKAIFGVLKPTGGEVNYSRRNITGHTPAENVKNGICFIPQERYVFPDMSVEENLELCLRAKSQKGEIEKALENVYTLFPILQKRTGQRAESLSGGERRMLGLSMALMMKPNLLMLDEPSLGLSPLVVKNLGSIIEGIARSGVGVLLVEQNVKQALRLSSRVYVMKSGRIVLEERGQKLLEEGKWWTLF